MRILVTIANYGFKNVKYLKRLIYEYQSMPFQTDIVILSNVPKNFEPNIEVIVGLPTMDPWSLPFGHKKLFVDRINDYDLFIYSEDDTLITVRNIQAFLEVSKVLDKNQIAGFLRYEVTPNGKRSFIDAHSNYHWLLNSVETKEGLTFASFTNEHSACYLITREQLKKAIRSGGFLVAPHQGKYDLLCSAATDPYTQCGLTKVICISHLEDFILHHLPNVYLERLGCSESDFQLQVNTLLEIAGSERTAEALFQTEKPKPFEKWNKSYYELCSKEILDLVPTGAKKVLSVGSGVGLAETQLAALGLDITCIPLDSIVSACTKAKGFRMSPSNFPRAFDFLAQDKFDCILLLRIIQHLREPTHILYKLQNLLEPHGIMIITAPNFNYYPTWVNTLGFRCKWWWSVKFDRSGLHFTTIRNLKRWIINSNMKVRNVLFQNRKKKKFRNKEFTIPVKGISAKEIILTAHEKK